MAALRETYSLAHSARCKLHLAADRPDRDLRFLVGHAMHLDALMLRIVEIEEGESHDSPSSTVAATGVKADPTPIATNLKKQPLSPNHDGSDEDVPELEDDDEEDLGLTRFPSASAALPRRIEDIQNSGSSSSSDDEGDEEDYAELLREVIGRNGGGDAGLAKMYHDVEACPCHGTTGALEVGRMWEIPGMKSGVRKAAVEVTA